MRVEAGQLRRWKSEHGFHETILLILERRRATRGPKRSGWDVLEFGEVVWYSSRNLEEHTEHIDEAG